MDLFSFNAPVLLEMYCSKRERRRGGSSCETCQMLAKAPSVPKQFWLHSLVRDPFSLFFSFTYTMEMIRQAELEPERTHTKISQDSFHHSRFPPIEVFQTQKHLQIPLWLFFVMPVWHPVLEERDFLISVWHKKKQKDQMKTLHFFHFTSFTSLLLSRSSLPPSLQFLWITSCKSPFLSAFTAFSFFNFLLLLLPSARTFIVESSSS